MSRGSACSRINEVLSRENAYRNSSHRKDELFSLGAGGVHAAEPEEEAEEEALGAPVRRPDRQATPDIYLRKQRK